MQKFALTLFVALAAPAVSAVDIPEACLICRNAIDDTMFVECLQNCLDPVDVRQDRATPTPDAAQAKAAAERAGWMTADDVDEMSDARRLVAAKASNEGLSYFLEPIYPQLVFVGTEDGMEAVGILVSPAQTLIGLGGEQPMFRVDKNKAVKPRVSTDDDNELVVIEDDKLLEQILSGQTLRVRMDILGVDTKDFSFDLSGSRDAFTWTHSVIPE